MKKQIPIGIADFKEVMESKYYYVDKTLLAQDVVNSSAKVLLFPRPRRFGKTLNLSMLRYFFEKCEEDRNSLFMDTLISHTEIFQQHQGKYPVIYLTFKDLKDSTWNSMLEGIQHLLKDEFFRHEEV